MHHETVGRHLVGSIGRGHGDETVAGVLARLATEKPSSVELICVTDSAGRLLGALPIARLFALEGAVTLREAMDPAFPRIGPDEDQETAASLALHHGVDALPVVDREGGLLGVMPCQALLQVLRQEHVEDLHVLAGIRRETTKARHAIEDPPMRGARHRLPWLFARRGLDPAYGSGPVATVIQDILSILVYFTVLRAFGI